MRQETQHANRINEFETRRRFLAKIIALGACGIQAKLHAAKTLGNRVLLAQIHKEEISGIGSNIDQFLLSFDSSLDSWKQRYPGYFSSENLTLIAALCEPVLGIELTSKELDSVVKGSLVTFSLQPLVARDSIDQLATLLSYSLVQMFFGKGLRLLHELDLNERIQVCGDWQRSPINKLRQGFAGYHSIIQAAYYSNPTHWKALGYQGPPRFNLN